ncbi:MAG TPA: DNA-binding protein, partial [Lachnospiraceae bacterium]|nr:DNA-binding protein [Lachnospiraceae bacterium]
WTYDFGRKTSEVKKVTYYFKPEENAVYFVTDDGTEGRFEI